MYYSDKRADERQVLQTSLVLRLENRNAYIYELINLGRTFNRETIDPFYRVLSIASSCRRDTRFLQKDHDLKWRNMFLFLQT